MTPRKFTLPPSLCICRNPECKISYGLCHCGCGEKTKIADRTYHKIGWIVDVPTRFIMGHANRKSRISFIDATPFKIEGVPCKLLSLTRGLFAIIDAAEYERVSRMHWYAAKAKNGYYAVRKYPSKKKVTGDALYLHRFLLGLNRGEPSQGDHKNGVTLDCRGKNLRPVSEQENKWNHKVSKSNTSGREGVYPVEEKRAFVARMRIDGKMTHLGYSKTFEGACAIREAAENKHRGEFVRKK